MGTTTDITLSFFAAPRMTVLEWIVNPMLLTPTVSVARLMTDPAAALILPKQSSIMSDIMNKR